LRARNEVESLQPEDDDTLFLPKWMFKALRVKEGDPLCLTFDFEESKKISDESFETQHIKIAKAVDLELIACENFKGKAIKNLSETSSISIENGDPERLTKPKFI